LTKFRNDLGMLASGRGGELQVGQMLSQHYKPVYNQSYANMIRSKAGRALWWI